MNPELVNTKLLNIVWRLGQERLAFWQARCLFFKKCKPFAGISV